MAAVYMSTKDLLLTSNVGNIGATVKSKSLKRFLKMKIRI